MIHVAADEDAMEGVHDGNSVKNPVSYLPMNQISLMKEREKMPREERWQKRCDVAVFMHGSDQLSCRIEDTRSTIRYECNV